jgi:hypothetical protein
MVFFPIYRLFNNDYDQSKHWILLVGLLLFIFFLVFTFLSLLGIFRIKYSEETGDIVLYHLYKSKGINVEEVAAFYQFTYKTKWKDYRGYILQLKDGSLIKLTEYNTKPLFDFYHFIVSSGVVSKGYKTSWLP